MWDFHWGSGSMMGGIGMILIWGLIIVLIIFAVRWLGGSGLSRDTTPTEAPPLQILQERYARGEIDKEEYEERRKVLGG